MYHRGRPKEYGRGGRVIFTTSADGDLLDQFQDIVIREGKPMNRVLQDLMAQYVKTHAGGNPTFSLEKWQENPEFVGDPALRESNEKWDRYLSQCDEKELADLEGVFITRKEQAKKAWIKKKRYG